MPSEHSLRAVLFDMDGTLLRLDVDIEEVRTRLAALFAPYGVTAPFRPILKRIPEAAREASARGGDAALLERQGFAILDEFEVAGAARARGRAGVAEVVSTLTARGFRLGIVTDNGRACVPTALTAAGLSPGSFAAVSTRDDVALPKPDPAGIVRAAGLLAPARVLWYVGDHPKDVQTGRAAAGRVPGLQIAAISGGWATGKDLEAAGADALASDLTSILELPGLSE